MSASRRLKELRASIDRIDEQIQQLINDRANIASEIAKAKLESGEGSFYRPEREAQILRNIAARNDGPLSDGKITGIFREIISATLSLESETTVAFLGPEGTFTQDAALKHFGHSANTVAVETIDGVFRVVESDTAQFGVVPIENSTEGAVTHTLDMLLDSPLRICGEIELRIRHNLLSQEESLDAVERVLAHGQTVAQCRLWLNSKLSHAEAITVSSNAEAARRAAEDSGTAAIASRTAAELYGLRVLAANIEDSSINTTRFLVLGKIETESSGDDKTSLLLSSKDRPGALYRLLEPLARHGVSMTRIESRPSRKGLWEYVFFIDIEGHAKDKAVTAVLSELRAEAAFLKLLGSYPRSVS
ncbi:MAG: prephenate dehydratase [Gammaproteobacteria bacterium]|nr:prephenate dehydratase [Gammaproteobacteria bacterium]